MTWLVWLFVRLLGRLEEARENWRMLVDAWRNPDRPPAD
jgi:hypothetical protein